MRTLTENNAVLTYTTEDEKIVCLDLGEAGLPIAAKTGHSVRSYFELLRKVAALNFHNPRFRLLYRGQPQDFKKDKDGIHSSLYPSILRSPKDAPKDAAYLDKQFERLHQAERLLDQKLQDRWFSQNQIVRWAILQHYEVCSTPLLDLTLSLQTALSFAVPEGSTNGFLYVFAFPQIAGSVSISIESMTQVIDLCHLCPPVALRPHFQSGFLAGDYPSYSSREETHGKKGMLGNNFACRLLAKFELQDCANWNAEGFTRTPDSVLFPNSADEWYSATQAIKAALPA
jgi:hypothetical protein